MKDSTYIRRYVEGAGNFFEDTGSLEVSHRLETRTRKGDVTDALKFKVYDPLWMLSRQWQMGEFRGNNAGTAMAVNCKIRSCPISDYTLGEGSGNAVAAGAESPIEPLVERIDRDLTPLARIESATYFMDLLVKYRDSIGDVRSFVKALSSDKNFCLEEDSLSIPGRGSLEHERIQSVTEGLNTRLCKFKNAYSGKACDGYKIYLYCQKGLKSGGNSGKIPKSLIAEYCNWFEDRYLPKHSSPSAWDERDLGYDFTAKNAVASYKADDYVGGRVSWYSFDLTSTNTAGRSNMKEETVQTLPTLASYAGAPNKRLWEFEDRKVFMGNSADMQAKGNVVFMQFATMYGNDWMICPLKTEVGKYIEVVGLDVVDTFGIKTVIKTRAGAKDKGASSFGQKWQMFTNAPADLRSGLVSDGLMFPPSLIGTLEGEPIEQVDILRDEMANMVWAVETRLDDGCGSSIDASLLASQVGQFVDEEYEEAVKKAYLKLTKTEEGDTLMESSRESDYKYKLMTSVPFNWIPFLPQHLNSKEERDQYSCFQGGGREIILRRAKMPCYYDKEYRPVRPLSSLLKVETVSDKGQVREVPLFINEEQVQGVGTVLVKNCQRSRWIGGKTYTWMGYSKQIKRTQGVSGLEYDNLVEPTE